MKKNSFQNIHNLIFVINKQKNIHARNGLTFEQKIYLHINRNNYV